MKNFLLRLWCIILGILLFSACSETEFLSSPKAAALEYELDQSWELFSKSLDSNLDSALFYAETTRSLALEANNKSRLADANEAIAYVYLKKGYLGDAVYHYLQAAKAFNEIGDLYNLADVYNSLGYHYSHAKDYNSAIIYYSKAREIYDYKGTAGDKAMVLRNLAVSYKEIEEFSKAEECLVLSQKEALKDADHQMMAKIFNSRGAVAFKQKKLGLAREYYFKALHYADSLPKGKRLQAATKNNIGEVYLEEGDFQKSEEWFDKALEIKKELEDPIFLQATLINLGRLRMRQGRYSEVVEVVGKGLEAIDVNVVDNAIGESLDLINKALIAKSRNGDVENVLRLNQELAAYNGKLAEFNNKVFRLKEELEAVSKQQSLHLGADKFSLTEKLGQSKEEKEQMKLTAFLVPVLILLIASAVFYWFIRRQRRSKALMGAIEEVLNQSAKRHHPKA